MRLTDFVFAAFTVTVGLAAFVVAVRLLVRTARCRARTGRLAMMLGGTVTLLGLGAARLFDAVDNVFWHPHLPILMSAWFSCVSAAVMAVWFEVFGRHTVERAGFERRLTELATTDPLTGILNRRACVERGEALAEAARRFGHPLTVMMIDIDHYKRINDRHGHEAGDEVLRLFASTVKGCLRRVDVFGRLGGEEFAVLMPEATAAGAAVAAERIRIAVAEAELDRGGQQALSITASIGCVAGTGTLDEALRRADAALYRAKQDGRNRVVMAESDGS